MKYFVGQIAFLLGSLANSQPYADVVSAIEEGQSAVTMTGARSCSSTKLTSSVDHKNVSDKCSQVLTKEEKTVIAKIKNEIAHLPPMSLNELNSTIRAILVKHQTSLTSVAMMHLLAEASKKKFDDVREEFRKNPALSSSYLKFLAAVEQYMQNVDRVFGGIREFDRNMSALKSAKEDFFISIDNSGLSPLTKREIKKGVYQLLISSYDHGVNRAMDAARHFAYLGLTASAVGVAGLVGAAVILPASIPVSGSMLAGLSLGNILAGTAVATVSGMAGGAAFMGGLNIAKTLARASVDVPGTDFFCRLAEESGYEWQRFEKDLNAGAKIGGMLGASLTSLAVYYPAASNIASGIATTGFTSLQVVETLNETAEANRLTEQARIAANNGDDEEAGRYSTAAKKKMREAYVDAGTTAFGVTGIAKIGENAKKQVGSASNHPDKMLTEPRALEHSSANPKKVDGFSNNITEPAPKDVISEFERKGAPEPGGNKKEAVNEPQRVINITDRLRLINGVRGRDPQIALFFEFHAKTIREINQILGKLEAPVGDIVLYTVGLDIGHPQGLADIRKGELNTHPFGVTSDLKTRTNRDPGTGHEYMHFVYHRNVTLRLPEFRKMENDPYNELVGDLGESLHTGDGSGVASSLPRQGYDHMRDFFSTNRDLPDTLSAHQLFAETRWFIGDHYLKNPAFAKQQSLVLNSVFDAIIEIFGSKKYAGRSLDSRSPENYSKEEAKIFNQDLISRIKSRLPTE